jgi:hypothetical protein
MQCMYVIFFLDIIAFSFSIIRNFSFCIICILFILSRCLLWYALGSGHTRQHYVIMASVFISKKNLFSNSSFFFLFFLVL